MMTLSDLWRHFRFLTDMETFSEEQKATLHSFLVQEHQRRENRRIEYLLKMSGMKRVKLLSDFDWKFNPKVPRDKILAFMNTDWLKSPANLVMIGPTGVGKSHIAAAFCHDAVMKGKQTVFTTLFDLTMWVRTDICGNAHKLLSAVGLKPSPKILRLIKNENVGAQT